MAGIGSLLGLGFKALGGAGKTAFGLARGGAVGRTALGGMVGGISGYAGTDFQSNQLTLEAVGKGALLGAFAGGVLPGAAKMVTGMLWRNKMALAKGGLKGGWSAAKGAAKLGRFAFEHPLLTAGVVGSAYAGSRMLDTPSPTLSGARMNVKLDEQNAAMN